MKTPEQKEKHRLYCIEWRKRNVEAVRKSGRDSYAKNREKRIEAVAFYKATNPEKVKATKRHWIKENPEIQRRHVRIAQQNRRAKKKANGGKLSGGLSAILLKLQKGKCACCKAKLGSYHLDHIMPLALGGANSDDNIQLLCPTCNLQKNAKHPVDFMQEKGFLL